MATSPRAFLIELYEEYLEESSFLYEQRHTLHHNPEITWKKIGEFEDRLEAHIDGLVVGDKLALDVCKARAAEGDSGELFAATSVFCRQERRELALTIFDQLEPEDAKKAVAVADALKYELPEVWYPDFLTLLANGDPKLAPILARAFGYRRVQCGPQLMSALKRCSSPVLPEVVWALGRIGYEPAVEPLLDYLRSEDEPVRSAAALALARMGERRAIDYCVDQAPANTWPIVALGLAGGRSALAVLTERSRSGAGDCLVALGLLGSPESVPLLISQLEHPDGAVGAATALQCLTGASLYETVFVPEEVDEDELFESEREQLKQGKPLDRGDGRPYGSTVTRLSQKPEGWIRWWQTNGNRFAPVVRYRNGGPVSPARLIEMLADERTPHRLRRYCAEELVIRYRKDFGLETDMAATRQTKILSEATAWSASSGGQFQEGVWYLAGHRSG